MKIVGHITKKKLHCAHSYICCENVVPSIYIHLYIQRHGVSIMSYLLHDQDADAEFKSKQAVQPIIKLVTG